VSAPTHEGGIAAQMTSAMDEYRRMRVEGVSQADAVRGLEYVLRQVIPQTSHGPRCRRCDDTHWEHVACQGSPSASCGRVRPHDEHECVRRCVCWELQAAARQAARETDQIADMAQRRRRR